MGSDAQGFAPPNLVKMTKFDDFPIKIAKLFVFFPHLAQQGFVPYLVGLLERFSSILTGRFQFYKVMTVKIGSIEI